MKTINRTMVRIANERCSTQFRPTSLFKGLMGAGGASLVARGVFVAVRGGWAAGIGVAA